MPTYDSLIDRLRAQFEAPQPTVEAVVNDRHRRLVSESRWRQSVQVLATTVAGTSSYQLPAGLVHLSDVKVDGAVYEWAPEADIWRLSTSDNGRWFSLLDDASATPTLQITPAPTENGKSITGIAVLL